MQLKRDTDYALRVLFCIQDNQEIGRQAKGMRPSELSSRSGVPKLAIRRICEQLSDGDILQYRVVSAVRGKAKEERAYYSRDGFAGITLLDVVETMEGTGKIFSVFDQQSPMYGKCEEQILAVQDKAEQTLRSVSLKTFLGMHNFVYLIKMKENL